MGITPSEYLLRELRRRRIAAGLTQVELGQRCFCSDTHISAIETGGKPPTLKHLQLVDAAIPTDGFFENLWEELVKDSADPIWLIEWIEYERKAVYLRWYEPAFVPGLLQTEEYARATLRASRRFSDEEVERRVTSRMDRQSIFNRDEPPEFYVVLDEAVLHRTVSDDRELMERQLEHLTDFAKRPCVKIQVVPAAVGLYPGLSGGFILAAMPDGTNVGHLDHQLGADVIERPDAVANLAKAWEDIRGDALPLRQSSNFIEEARQTWK
nr:Scr1 family TA system antitoxin-like transcriptional regulator [Micromonospora sp. DSM 115978]